MPTPERLTRYRSVFAVGVFRVLFATHALFVTGETIRMLALSVAVYADTGSTLASSLAYMAGMLGYAAGAFLFLSAGDKIPPRHALTTMHLIRFTVTATIATGVPSPAVAIALTVIPGFFGPVSIAASGRLLTEVLDGDAYVLGRSVFSMTSTGVQIVAQAATGLLLTACTPGELLAAAAATCMIAALVAWSGLRGTPAGQGTAETSPRATWRATRRLLAAPRVRGLLLAQWLPLSLAVGAEGVVVPYASTAAPAAPGAFAGTLLGLFAAGAMLGDLVIGRFVPPGRRARWTRPLALLPGLALAPFIVQPGPVLACALGMVAFFGLAYQLGLQRPFIDATPADARGHALGLATTGLMCGQALATVGAGALGEIIAPPGVIAVCGLASAAAALALSPHLRPGPTR
ncbi:hypothetical protein [Actinokineospora enzanensis]|uniref:hypothetical protein n=1 Tax=Actinokineospora enzanensis TaxID=155975 RepID=UPI00035EFE67|nr:hypothetical protein [Actinokineospora enzanensis]